MPDVTKAELIEGVVYMPSPVRYSHHGLPHAILAGWLNNYLEGRDGIQFAIASSLRIDLDNEVQPDLMLRRLDERAASHVDEDGYVQGAPELLVEVAASTVSYDLHQKKQVYRRAGVREYLVLRTEDAAVDWFVLRDGSYVAQVPDESGALHSEAFPGLRLDTAQLLSELARGGK